MKPISTQEHSALAMRFVLDQAARAFRVELHDADLRGGGAITGRVHRNGGGSLDGVAVRVRCTETWRDAPPLVAIVSTVRARSPRWHDHVLWSEECELSGDESAHWAGFRVEIPPGLPPAVEARSIAWRYEVLAIRPRRIGFDETAVITPLHYRAMLIDNSMPFPTRLA